MIAKSVLHLHDLSSLLRVELAAEQLASGLGVVFEDTWFLYESGHLWCQAIHKGQHDDMPTEAAAYVRIAESREALGRLRAAHPAIESLVGHAPVSYAVVEDYGQGVAPIYCLVAEQLVSAEEAWRVWRRP
jgi:hypothetical protein